MSEPIASTAFSLKDSSRYANHPGVCEAVHGLLILGEPGAGKSPFVLQLAQHLEELAERNLKSYMMSLPIGCTTQ